MHIVLYNLIIICSLICGQTRKPPANRDVTQSQILTQSFEENQLNASTSTHQSSDAATPADTSASDISVDTLPDIPTPDVCCRTKYICKHVLKARKRRAEDVPTTTEAKVQKMVSKLQQLKEQIQNYTLPGQGWGICSNSKFSYLSFVKMKENGCVDKVLYLTESSNVVTGSLLIREKKVPQNKFCVPEINSYRDIRKLLRQINKLKVCNGYGYGSGELSNGCHIILTEQKTTICKCCKHKRAHLRQRNRRIGNNQTDTADKSKKKCSNAIYRLRQLVNIGRKKSYCFYKL